MDVMTALLLDTLSDGDLKGSSQILDFCSGSGTIARHVLQRHPSVDCGRHTVTLLDADAIVLNACHAACMFCSPYMCCVVVDRCGGP